MGSLPFWRPLCSVGFANNTDLARYSMRNEGLCSNLDCILACRCSLLPWWVLSTMDMVSPHQASWAAHFVVQAHHAERTCFLAFSLALYTWVRWRCLLLMSEEQQNSMQMSCADMVCCAALGTLWYAVAVAAVSLTKIYRANQDNKPLPVLLLGVVAASGECPPPSATPLFPLSSREASGCLCIKVHKRKGQGLACDGLVF